MEEYEARDENVEKEVKEAEEEIQKVFQDREELETENKRLQHD